MREIIESFLSSDRLEIPLQVQPLEIYDTILSDNGYTNIYKKKEIEPDTRVFTYFYEKDGDILLLLGSLWIGNYKLMRSVR